MRVFDHATAKAATALFCAAFAAAGVAAAQESCGTCDKEIVTNQELADCFLEQYDNLARAKDGVVLVDLSACPQTRGVVEALAGPASGTAEQTAEPSLKFMVSQAQLACLKQKLEDPAIKLDPSAKIELESCG